MLFFLMYNNGLPVTKVILKIIFILNSMSLSPNTYQSISQQNKWQVADFIPNTFNSVENSYWYFGSR